MSDRPDKPVPVTPLGQTGFKFVFDGLVVYIDPYLTDSVADAEGDALRRMTPPPMRPEQVVDADYVLISHLHRDHCDPDTLLPIFAASPKSRFVCPNEVAAHLMNLGMTKDRITTAKNAWISLDSRVKVLPLPAAHPLIERDPDNLPKCVSYVLEYGGRKFYHAGDTSPHDELISRLKQIGPIDTAFLPVNEKNYYREKSGIIGNMSVREAFGMAEEIGARVLVPTHWDLFAPNSVYREELELLYRLMRPPFRLIIDPIEI